MCPYCSSSVVAAGGTGIIPGATGGRVGEQPIIVEAIDTRRKDKIFLGSQLEKNFISNIAFIEDIRLSIIYEVTYNSEAIHFTLK